MTDAQVRKLREEMSKHGRIGVAALRSGMSERTARKYLQASKFPSELAPVRHWRTRQDPFVEDWPAIKERLVQAPELEAKALFEFLCETHPGRYEAGQLRSFQRRLRQWRAQEGPPKEVFFPQVHVAGEALQTDFTWATQLGVTIVQEPLPHLFCHSTLPFSNWEWGIVAHSESFAALRRGLQATLLELGRVPAFHQTDNTPVATHALPDGSRGFNDDYRELVAHFGMQPRTIGIRKPNQNGDVESLGGALKRRLEQHLLLRGSRDFDSTAAYEAFVQGVLRKANGTRSQKLGEEMAAMRPLGAGWLPELSEEQTRVRSDATILVAGNVYSVPARLRDEIVRTRLYEDRLEVFHGGTRQLVTERLHGRGKARIDYRHVIRSLVRKPGAFARYRYREELFPSVVFRQAYDGLRAKLSEGRADETYLEVLHLAALTMESEVEAAVALLLEAGEMATVEAVKSLIGAHRPVLLEMPVYEVDLGVYDGLLTQSEERVAS